MLARARLQMAWMVARRKPSSEKTSAAASRRRWRVSAARLTVDISNANFKYAFDRVKRDAAEKSGRTAAIRPGPGPGSRGGRGPAVRGGAHGQDARRCAGIRCRPPRWRAVAGRDPRLAETLPGPIPGARRRGLF